ncbi:MAG: lipoprotein LpqH [Mycobacterium sp.]
MKRGFVVAIGGAAIVVAGLAGCSSNKSSEATQTAASGTGKAKVTIDGQDQNIQGSISCVTQGDTVNIAIGETQPGANAGIGAQVTTGDNPTVKNVALGTVNGVALAYTAGTGQGNADAKKDGKTYKISGNAVGADMSNPMAGMQNKPFELEVTCP